MEKVAVYASFKNQNRKSIDFFLKRIADYCLMKNYDYTIYFDKVKSRLDLDRKELNNLKEDIENKEYSKIVIKDITQLSRNTIYNVEFLHFLDDNKFNDNKSKNKNKNKLYSANANYLQFMNNSKQIKHKEANNLELNQDLIEYANATNKICVSIINGLGVFVEIHLHHMNYFNGNTPSELRRILDYYVPNIMNNDYYVNKAMLMINKK